MHINYHQYHNHLYPWHGLNWEANMCHCHTEDTDMFLALRSQPDTRSPSPLTCFSVGVLYLPFKQALDKPEQDAPVLHECSCKGDWAPNPFSLIPLPRHHFVERSHAYMLKTPGILDQFHFTTEACFVYMDPVLSNLFLFRRRLARAYPSKGARPPGSTGGQLEKRTTPLHSLCPRVNCSSQQKMGRENRFLAAR